MMASVLLCHLAQVISLPDDCIVYTLFLSVKSAGLQQGTRTLRSNKKQCLIKSLSKAGT